MQLPGLTPLGAHGLITGGRTADYTHALRQQAQDVTASDTHGTAEVEKMRLVAREFTALFIGEVFKAMDTVEPTSGIGYGGTPELFFKEMLYEEYAREIASGKEMGLAELVYQGLRRQQSLAAGAGL